ncbi:hypothetical protein FZC78_17065 [Rossellomorea vietnamensis]|uniref:Lipoprotein n=1 Tax=Rossellomorea vietnamensis TaxID=218284 RepID=A0A5D4NMZ3_9BACI|nr:hypothetical protein [Rossellomorea vietnamensis]TYS15004.1 hypothetical protein FZC78_17065 [Rossellomorea vietnamensis]
MKIKTTGAALLLSSSMLLASCTSEENSLAEDENMNQGTQETDKGTTNSGTPAEEPEAAGSTEDDSAGQADTNEDQAGSEDQNNTDHSLQNNDTSGLPEGIQQTDYETVNKAAKAFDNYREVKQTNTDLGYSIQALVEGAAGHQYISWNEGRWLIQMDFPTDPQYAYDPYPEGVDFAKEVVEYLETHYLPAPEDRGMISINGFAEHPQTDIQWQKGKTVYEINNENGKPFEAIDRAVEFGDANES